MSRTYTYRIHARRKVATSTYEGQEGIVEAANKPAALEIFAVRYPGLGDAIVEVTRLD